MKVDISRVKRYCHIVFDAPYPYDPFYADDLRRTTHDYMAACLCGKPVKNINEARGLVKSAFTLVEDKWFRDKNYRNLDKITACFKRLLDQIDDDISSGKSPEQVIAKMMKEEMLTKPESKVKSLCKCKECGHEAIVRSDDIGWFVRCINDFCDNSTEYFDIPNEAVDVWNGRQ